MSMRILLGPLQQGPYAALEVLNVPSALAAGWPPTAAERDGSVGVLVSNAGIAEPKRPLHELDANHWRWALEVTLTGMALPVKQALRYMADQGSGAVVAVSSLLELVGQSGSGPYSAARVYGAVEPEDHGWKRPTGTANPEEQEK